MPNSWVEPDIFLTYQGVTVYHAYKEDISEDRLFYWYQVDVTEQIPAFDIRDLPEYTPGLAHDEIFRRAIEHKSPLLLAELEKADLPDTAPPPWPLRPIRERDKLPTQAELLAYLKEQGAYGWVLNSFYRPFEDALGVGDFVLRYPIAAADCDGCHIVPVREGYMVLCYAAVDVDNYELYDIDNARLLDTDDCLCLQQKMRRYADHFCAAMEALRFELAAEKARQSQAVE